MMLLGTLIKSFIAAWTLASAKAAAPELFDETLTDPTFHDNNLASRSIFWPLINPFEKKERIKPSREFLMRAQERLSQRLPPEPLRENFLYDTPPPVPDSSLNLDRPIGGYTTTGSKPMEAPEHEHSKAVEAKPPPTKKPSASPDKPTPPARPVPTEVRKYVKPVEAPEHERLRAKPLPTQKPSASPDKPTPPARPVPTTVRKYVKPVETVDGASPDKPTPPARPVPTTVRKYVKPIEAPENERLKAPTKKPGASPDKPTPPARPVPTTVRKYVKPVETVAEPTAMPAKPTKSEQ